MELSIGAKNVTHKLGAVPDINNNRPELTLLRQAVMRLKEQSILSIPLLLGMARFKSEIRMIDQRIREGTLCRSGDQS